MDGKNRLLAVKEGDKIAARCKLQLLWDGKHPVVFRERVYPDQIPANYETALNNLAKKVAENMGVPLTCKDKGESYGKDLLALGGPAPYEYTDGGGGIQKEGCYTVQGVKRIN